MSKVTRRVLRLGIGLLLLLVVAAQQLFSAAGDLRHPPGYGAP